MAPVALSAAIISLIVWVGVLLAPWRPWSTRERLEPGSASGEAGLDDVTVLIPARDEAEVLPQTLASVAAQAERLAVIVVDDESCDDTSRVAAAAGPQVSVVRGAARPPGWSGKVWALEQGYAHVRTAHVLLLDADITLAPGVLPAMLAKLANENRAFVSLMASLRHERMAERVLLPAFVWFFKLLYPFGLANAAGSRVAAAAGGCVLIRSEIVDRLALFRRIHDALIDDCTLAREVKRAGGRGWLGLSRGVVSHRRYEGPGGIWRMVARSAYAQLNHSVLGLLGCTLAMGLVFWGPPLGVLAGGASVPIGTSAWLVMAAVYAPLLRYYDRSMLQGLILPVIATLFLVMTWHSALTHWMGAGTRWRGRVYGGAGSTIG